MTARHPRAAAMRLALIVMICGAITVGAIFTAGAVIATHTSQNCARIHQVVATLDQIMASGEAQVRRYVAEGLLTPAQGARADRERNKQRMVLAGADCT